MIQTENLTKRFDTFTAIDKMTCSIPDGCIYGMVGSNGAGKSTFLRLLAGIYKSNGGSISVDGQPVFENPAIKAKMLFVPDDLYFLPGANINRMVKLYRAIYPSFDEQRFSMLLSYFKLDPKKPVSTFSKGMRRQAATILALSSRPQYLLFDETFDGLDPIMRNFVKGLICNDVAERGITAIITSHSLRELEDTCDQLVLLHKGGVVLESDVQNLKTSQFKVQIAFNEDYTKDKFKGLQISSFVKSGSVSNMIVKGEREETYAYLKSLEPVLLDILPLTLEEVFTYEMEALGYDFKEVLEEISHD